MELLQASKSAVLGDDGRERPGPHGAVHAVFRGDPQTLCGDSTYLLNVFEVSFTDPALRQQRCFWCERSARRMLSDD